MQHRKEINKNNKEVIFPALVRVFSLQGRGNLLDSKLELYLFFIEIILQGKQRQSKEVVIKSDIYSLDDSLMLSTG